MCNVSFMWNIHKKRDLMGVKKGLVNVIVYWPRKKVPQHLRANIESWRKLDYFNVIIFNRIRAKNFIKKYFNEETQKAYDNCLSLNERTALFKYCTTLRMAGLFIDSYTAINLSRADKFIKFLKSSKSIVMLQKGEAIYNSFLFVRNRQNVTISKWLNESILIYKNRIIDKDANHQLDEYSTHQIFNSEFDNVTILKIEEAKAYLKFNWDFKKLITSKKNPQVVKSEGLVCVKRKTELNEHSFSIRNKVELNVIHKDVGIDYIKFNNVKLLVYPGIDGVLLDSKMRPLGHQFKHVRPKILEEALIACHQNDLVQRSIDCLGISLNPAWKNYFHFHTLIVPQHIFLQNYLSNGLTIPDPNNFKNSNVSSHFGRDKIEEVMNFYNIGKPNYLLKGVYNVRELVSIRINIKPNYKLIFTQAYQDILDSALERISTESKGRKIFLSRTGQVNRRNKYNYEGEIIRKYQLDDYEVISLNRMGFRDQMILFNECSHVAGLHGAAFTNILFTKNKLNIIEFTSLYNKDKFLRAHFADIATIKGHQYKLVELYDR